MRSNSTQSKKALAILPVAVVLILVAAAIIPMLADKGNNEKAEAAEVGFPFYFGLARGPEQIEPFLTYTFGDSPGTVPLDTVPNYPIAELFDQFVTIPSSHHPVGSAFIWIYDDAQNVYFVADWTSDNTYDDGADYTTVYVNDGSKLTVYSQHSDGGLYGNSFFTSTDMADYDHMVYIIAVPKSGLSSSTLNVGFEMYGTLTTEYFLSWNGIPPSTAVVNTTVNFSIAYELIESSEKPDAFGNMKAIVFEYNTNTNLNNFAAARYPHAAGGFFDDVFFDGTNWVRHYISPPGIKVLSASTIFNPVEVIGGGITTASGNVTIPLKFTTPGLHNIGILCYDDGGADEVGTYFNQWYGITPVTVTVNVTAGFTPVTDITGVPTTATAGTPLALTGTVVPAGATNKTIVWSVKDQGTTGATISGSTLSTTAVGTATVTATIADGIAVGAAFVKDFTISVGEGFVPVTDITGIPTTATAGTLLTLEGVVEPSNATNQTIVWSVKTAGDTGATISGNELSTTGPGTVTITATIADGTAIGTPFVKDFTITVNEQGSGSGIIGLWLGIAALVLLFVVYIVLKYVLKKNI